MGKYDYVDRRYFGKTERMAELLSKGLYRGRLQVHPEELVAADGKYQTLGSSNGLVERDGLFMCEKHRTMYGLEIENYSDYSMPKRFLSYDACEYERQAERIALLHKELGDYESYEERKSGLKESEVYYPVINLLLYVGEGHWRGRCSLREMFRVPKGLQAYLHDRIQSYSFGIVEADYVNLEEYEGDLRQFFKAMQCRYDKRKLDALFESGELEELPWDAQCAIAVHLNVKGLVQKVVEEEEKMCKAYRDLVKDWKAEGREEGRAEGERVGEERGLRIGEINGVLGSIKNLMQTMKLSAEEAMNALLVPEEERERFRAQL